MIFCGSGTPSAQVLTWYIFSSSSRRRNNPRAKPSVLVAESSPFFFLFSRFGPHNAREIRTQKFLLITSYSKINYNTRKKEVKQRTQGGFVPSSAKLQLWKLFKNRKGFTNMNKWVSSDRYKHIRLHALWDIRLQKYIKCTHF